MAKSQGLLLKAIKLIILLFFIALAVAMYLSQYFGRLLSDAIFFVWIILSNLILAETIRRMTLESKSKFRRIYFVFYAFCILFACGFVGEIRTVLIPFFSY